MSRLAVKQGYVESEGVLRHVISKAMLGCAVKQGCVEMRCAAELAFLSTNPSLRFLENWRVGYGGQSELFAIPFDHAFLNLCLAWRTSCSWKLRECVCICFDKLASLLIHLRYSLGQSATMQSSRAQVQ